MCEYIYSIITVLIWSFDICYDCLVLWIVAFGAYVVCAVVVLCVNHFLHNLARPFTLLITSTTVLCQRKILFFSFPYPSLCHVFFLYFSWPCQTFRRLEGFFCLLNTFYCQLNEIPFTWTTQHTAHRTQHTGHSTQST